MQVIANYPLQYTVYSLSHLPVTLQQHLLQEWVKKKETADQSSTEYLDLLMVLASSYRTGFAGTKDLSKARELALEAARRGSDAGQITSLSYSLLDGLGLRISTGEKVAWLKAALSKICFSGKQGADPVQDRFRAALDTVPDELLETSLLYSFIKSHMTIWEILNGDFDNAAEDPLFALAVNGELSSIIATLDSDLELLLRRKDGFTLLHVATDYCQTQMMRGRTPISIFCVSSV